jgi:hypothetical protein
VRFNYFPRDRIATVEMIAIIKDLAKLLTRMAIDLSQFLR